MDEYEMKEFIKNALGDVGTEAEKMPWDNKEFDEEECE